MLKEAAALKKYKKQVTSELKVKEALIHKLSDRNKALEVLMKKAVKIMQNPVVMRDAFKRFNFSKVTYTNEKNKIEILSAEGSGKQLMRGKPQSMSTEEFAR